MLVLAVSAALLLPKCAPAPALTQLNSCKAYDNACAGSAGYGGKLLQVPTVDAAVHGFMTSKEFIQRHVKGSVPLLIKNASHFFLKSPDLFTDDQLLQSDYAADLIDTTSSGREVSNREHNKHPDDPLIPLHQLFEGEQRTVFFQAWKVEERKARGAREFDSFSHEPVLGAQEDHLSRPRDGNAPDGDQSFDVSAYAFQHVKRNHGLFHHEGSFNFIMANEGGVLPHSHQAVMNILTQGAKRWTLVAPTAYASHDDQVAFEDWKDTGVGTKYLSSQWYSDKAAEIESRPHYDFVQEKGDAVFFPDGYTHATVDLCTPTIVFIQKGEFHHYGHGHKKGLRHRHDGQ